jgi:hypothetical protein
LGLVAKRQWSDLSRTQQRMIIAGAAVEVALTAFALADLARRPASQVRGPKPLWAATCFVQPVGPISYLMLGRRPS